MYTTALLFALCLSDSYISELSKLFFPRQFVTQPCHAHTHTHTLAHRQTHTHTHTHTCTHTDAVFPTFSVSLPVPRPHAHAQAEGQQEPLLQGRPQAARGAPQPRPRRAEVRGRGRQQQPRVGDRRRLHLARLPDLHASGWPCFHFVSTIFVLFLFIVYWDNRQSWSLAVLWKTTFYALSPPIQPQVLSSGNRIHQWKISSSITKLEILNPHQTQGFG